MNAYVLIVLSAVVCVSTTAAAEAYSTRFEGEENPLSDGGKWQNSGLDWTSVRASHGIAFGTQAGTNTGARQYDDSYAHLSGFPPDQEAWGQAYIATPDPSCHQELEILLRWASSPHRTTGYECFARCLNNGASYVQVVRWEGPLGKFTYLADLRGTNYGLKHGDILKASIVGNVITVSINGVEKARVTDDTYKTGNPGIGLFLHADGGRGVGSNTNFGFASFSAKGLGGSAKKEYSSVAWFDEFDFRLGGAISKPPMNAWTNGVWRRDFEHGIALVNPTKQPVTVTLEPGLRRLSGRQDSTVNNGNAADDVILQPKDGIILCRQGQDRAPLRR